MNVMGENNSTRPGVPSDGKDASHSFSFSLGRPPSGEPGGGEPDEGGSSQTARFEFANGRLRLDVGEGKQVEYDLALEESSGQYHDPFPALTTLGNWFNAALTILAIAVPIT